MFKAWWKNIFSAQTARSLIPLVTPKVYEEMEGSRSVRHFKVFHFCNPALL